MIKKELGILVLLAVIFIAVSILNPQFITATNLRNMANLIGMYGIFSIGVGVVIITGGIDLSVGSMFALLGILLADMLTVWHWPWPLAVVAVVLGGMSLGLIHGLLIARCGMQPFVVTLCGLLLYRGLARFIAADGTRGFGGCEGFETLAALVTGNVLGVPKTFVLMAAVGAVMWVVIHRSVYGRHLFAVGRNEEGARFSGINSRWVVANAYVISGGMAGVAAVLIAFYTNSISPSSHGNFYELYGIAAAVLGGCSLRGGEGSVLGIILGTILLQALQNLVNLLGIPSSLNFAVMGAVILAGVLGDQVISARRKARAITKGANAGEGTGKGGNHE